VQVRERLAGLGLMLAGTAVLAVLLLLNKLGAGLMAAPAPPPGVPAFVAISPLACFVPIIGLGALGLILVGLNRLLSPGP
jgi:hypothetical protein